MFLNCPTGLVERLGHSRKLAAVVKSLGVLTLSSIQVAHAGTFLVGLTPD